MIVSLLVAGGTPALLLSATLRDVRGIWLRLALVLQHQA
jgi:hypothetical protein